MRSTKHLPSPHLRGKLYPNGESKFGYCRVGGRKPKRAKSSDRALTDAPNQLEIGCQDATSQSGSHISSQEQNSPIGLSTLPISHKSPRKGSRGITSKQKIVIRNLAYLMGKSCPPGTQSLLTLTVPSLTDSEMLLVNRKWAEITRQMNQWLKRNLQLSGLPGELLGVSEIQEKRFEETKQVALHQHIVFQGRKRPFGQWALTPSQVRKQWLKLLSKAVGRTLESEAVERLERVRGNAKNYLAKYMSKGSKVIKQVHELGLSDQLPTAWYNASPSLRSLLKNSIRIVDEDALLILKHLPFLKQSKMIAYSHLTWLQNDDNSPPTLLGFYCRFPDVKTYDLAINCIKRFEEDKNIKYPIQAKAS